ncbi:MAG: hypothetical protein MH204_08130 [Fimbriimonadaceae bacterium]|nr:hypothetical protein [Fimbriimonadaceae bacterium]
MIKLEPYRARPLVLDRMGHSCIEGREDDSFDWFSSVAGFPPKPHGYWQAYEVWLRLEQEDIRRKVSGRNSPDNLRRRALAAWAEIGVTPETAVSTPWDEIRASRPAPIIRG